MRILVTGGAGSSGRSLQEASRYRHDVLCVDNYYGTRTTLPLVGYPLSKRCS